MARNQIHTTHPPSLCRSAATPRGSCSAAAPASPSSAHRARNPTGSISPRSENGLPGVGSRTRARGPDRNLFHKLWQVRTLKPRAHTWPTPFFSLESNLSPFREVWGNRSTSSRTDHDPDLLSFLSALPPGPTTPQGRPLSRCGFGHRAWSPLSCPSRSLWPRREIASATSQAEHNELKSAARVGIALARSSALQLPSLAAFRAETTFPRSLCGVSLSVYR